MSSEEVRLRNLCAKLIQESKLTRYQISNVLKDYSEEIPLQAIWIYLHKRSVWANQSKANTEAFIKELRWLADNFLCEKCKPEFQKYLQTHPPEREQDMFFYIFRFHNDVNKRLGKPEFPFESAKKIYISGTAPEPCHVCANNFVAPDRPVSNADLFWK